MLLYGAARDPATCKPTKDSEIAARPALVRSSSPPPLSTLPPPPSHPATRSRSFSLSSPLGSPRRPENTTGQYRNVFTAIRSRRQNLARSSGKVAEVVVAILAGSSLSGGASFSGSSAVRLVLVVVVVVAIAIARLAYREKPAIDSRQRPSVRSLSLSFFFFFFLSFSLVAELPLVSRV